MNPPGLLVVILGPTASGKSALAIRLAQALSGEVVVCDSTQVYRHFSIGTGKVPVADRHGIPHHMMDLVEPEEIFTAGNYRRCALAALEAIRNRGNLPILTAGTGLYLRALLEGLANAPARSEELRSRLRTRAEKHGASYLPHLLKRLDPESSTRIASRDAQKMIRAIEVRLLSGKRLSDLHRNGRTSLEDFRVAKIGLLPPRAELYACINQRVASMLEQGWLDEVRRILERGTPATSKPFTFIGYADLLGHLRGQITLEEATGKIQQATRRFAKRQMTWFRKETGVHWFPGFGHEPEIYESALEYLAGKAQK